MKVAVALDLPTVDENYSVAEKLSQLPDELKQRLAFKVGLSSYTAGGPEYVKRIVALGLETVLDLKLFDIPNTMVGAAKQIASLGVSMFTVHASAGQHAIFEVKKALTGPDYKNPPKILGVTVLTSMTTEVCKNLFGRDLEEQVAKLIGEAYHGGCDGIVCSPLELPAIDGCVERVNLRSGPPKKLIRFVPGIELEKRNDDQKRKGGLKEVLRGGADYIVVGRPIYQAEDPAATATKLLTKIGKLEDLDHQFEEELKWES
jgi:orotidine-5'-phosphate decarboxylase